MVAIIFTFGLVTSFFLATVRSWQLHYIFVFLLFLVNGIIISYSDVLNDIVVYRDAFYSPDKSSLYFEPTFRIFLEITEPFNFEIVYGLTIALSALMTYVVLIRFIPRNDFLSTFIFIALFSTQFTLAWRQALAMPGIVYCCCYFLVYARRKPLHLNPKVIFSLFGSTFHTSGMLSFFSLVFRPGNAVLQILFISLLFTLLLFVGEELAEIIRLRFVGSSSYIDVTTHSSGRASLVFCKFLGLLLIAYLLRDSLKHYNINGVVLSFLIVKIAVAGVAIFYPSPSWGRILGLLTFVDFIVISHGLSRSAMLSIPYLLVSFGASTALNPYYH